MKISFGYLTNRENIVIISYSGIRDILNIHSKINGCAMNIKILPITRLLFALSLPILGWSAESAPSPTVGYWKLTVHHGYTQISFPLLPANKSLNYVLNGQLTPGNSASTSDQIIGWDANSQLYQVCWRNIASGNWEGDFDSLSEAKSYWIYVQPNHPAEQTLISAGHLVAFDSYDMGIILPGYNAVGSVWVTPSNIFQAGLEGFQGGLYLFNSDQILHFDALSGYYLSAWKNEAGLWQGNLMQLEPFKGYWIYISPTHPGFAWPNFPRPDTALGENSKIIK
jgi:hypothetical protein